MDKSTFWRSQPPGTHIHHASVDFLSPGGIDSNASDDRHMFGDIYEKLTVVSRFMA